MSSKTKLTREKDGESVDNTKYRGMIGSLLYLTASRPNIMFSVCLCARFQEDPKSSHLEVIKGIFRYIKGTKHLGLWYPKETGVETIVYADFDHAEDYVNRKMPKSTNDKKDNKSLKRTDRISVRACCLVNPPSSSPPYQRFSPPSDYLTAPPSTHFDSPSPTPITPSSFSPSERLTTPKTTPPPLTTPPSAPSQPSKKSLPLAINLKPMELIFLTPPLLFIHSLTPSKTFHRGPPILLLIPRLTPSDDWLANHLRSPKSWNYLYHHNFRHKQCDEDDAARQEAIMGIITLFGQEREAKEDLRKQYAECIDISLERRALIDKFLDDEAWKDSEVKKTL
ncbi:hypothetical protein Tco_0709185 [Tanacetum coccineum]